MYIFCLACNIVMILLYMYVHMLLIICTFIVVHTYMYLAPVSGLPNSSEYLAAMELEMWKLSQEETFTENMKNKEAKYLCSLGEEWKKREEERQRVFTKKVRTCTYVYM